MASQRSFYDKNFRNLLGEAEHLSEPYDFEFEAVSTPGRWSGITHLYAASAALKVAFRSYCPPVINEYFMSSPLSRKICGRGVNRSAVPMAIVMWSSSIVPHVEGDFRPNHFVVLQKMETRPEYVDLTANSSTTSAHDDFTLASHNDSEKALSGHLKYVAAAAAADDDDDDDMSNIRDLDEVPTSPTTDFPDEDPASPASSFPDAEPTSPAEASIHEVDHEADIQATGRSLTDGKFLGILELIDTLTVSKGGLPSIPMGQKKNTLFIIQNKKNMDRRAVGQGCFFTDDCGAWKDSPSSVTRMIKNGERWQSIILRRGQYGTEQRIDGRKMFVPAEPQPREEDVLKVHRKYTTLKAAENYKRRVTWLEPAPSLFACVEYIGHYPDGAAPHGNAKIIGEPYHRTDPSVMDAIKEASGTMKPREIYERLKRKPTEEERPKNLRQVKNTVYNAQKIRREKEGNQQQGGQNLDDNIHHLHNAIHDHPFIQEIFHTKQHVPGIVLFTTKQIQDIRRFCCSAPLGEGTVLGVDKTFNLGQLHVTPAVFKNLGIVRPTTNTHPLFIGPTLVHGNSDTKTYNTFFHFIRQAIEGAPRELVIGSDEEMAIRKAAKSVFPTCSLIACLRHLKTNMKVYLRDKLGAATTTRHNIVTAVFGPGGLTSSPTTAIFEARLTNIQTTINDQAPGYLQHFNTHLLPILKENLDTTLTRTEAPPDWTNNNSESINHILKMKIDWRPQAIPQLINSIYEVVQGHYTDVERAIMGQGEYRLHKDFEELFVQPAVWCSKSDDQRRRHLDKFQMALKTTRSISTSSNGDIIVLTSGARGKKIGQKKRAKATRTGRL